MPPLSEYMMPEDAEAALAKSAAPQNISDHATIRVLTPSGYKIVRQGDNDFVCMVMRGFTGAPTFGPADERIYVNYDAKTRAPVCFNPQAVKTALPYFDLRTKLGLEGKTPDQITAALNPPTIKARSRNVPGALHTCGQRIRSWGPLVIGILI